MLFRRYSSVQLDGMDGMASNDKYVIWLVFIFFFLFLLHLFWVWFADSNLIRTVDFSMWSKQNLYATITMLEHKPQVQTYNDLFKMIRGHFGMRMSHPSRAKWKDFHIIFVSAIFLLLLFKCQIHLQLLLPRRSMRCVYLLYYYLYVRLFYAWFLCFIFQFRLLHKMVTDVGGATKIAGWPLMYRSHCGYQEKKI